MSDQDNGTQDKKDAVIVDLQTVRNVKTLLDYAGKRAEVIKNLEQAYPGLWRQTENEVLREMLAEQHQEHYRILHSRQALSNRFNQASMVFGGLMGIAAGTSIAASQSPEVTSMVTHGVFPVSFAVVAAMIYYARKKMKDEKPLPYPDMFEKTRQRILDKLTPS